MQDLKSKIKSERKIILNFFREALPTYIIELICEDQSDGELDYSDFPMGDENPQVSLTELVNWLEKHK